MAGVKWLRIGSWDFYYDAGKVEFVGRRIPQWLKSKIIPLLNELIKSNAKRRGLNLAHVQRVDNLNGIRNGLRIVRGKHFEYKVIFREGDQSSYGEIWRRPIIY